MKMKMKTMEDSIETKTEILKNLGIDLINNPLNMEKFIYDDGEDEVEVKGGNSKESKKIDYDIKIFRKGNTQYIPIIFTKGRKGEKIINNQENMILVNMPQDSLFQIEIKIEHKNRFEIDSIAIFMGHQHSSFSTKDSNHFCLVGKVFGKISDLIKIKFGEKVFHVPFKIEPTN